MRTIEQISGINKEVNADFPDGAIINETDTVQGTPVIREIYNDILQNNYKLLDTVGIEPTGTEDKESSQFQILEAHKLLPNKTNDIEQVLSLNGSVWSIPLSLEIMPNKFFFLARATDGYVSGSSYTFKGSGSAEYSFSSIGFKSGDELLVIVDQSGVRAYFLASSSASDTNEVFTIMGMPLGFNDGTNLWYQQSGVLMSDIPSSYNLESIIKANVADPTALLTDMFVMNGKVVCFCNLPGSNTYFFRQFDLLDLTVSVPVVLSGASFSNTSDFSPYVYAEAGNIYVTNGMNSTANSYSLTKLAYNAGASTLTFVSSFSLDNTFVKTSNAAAKSGVLYSMVSGELNSFNLSSGVKSSLGIFPSVSGQLFGFGSNVYFSSGEVAKKWF